jgi:hypothetical protein
MNKQEAYEIARNAELKRILNRIEETALSGEYDRQVIVSNREVINELSKLGFNCGLIDEEKNIWHIDWSN